MIWPGLAPPAPLIASFSVSAWAMAEGQAGQGSVVLEGRGARPTPRPLPATAHRNPALSALHVYLFGIGISLYDKKIKNDL